jgi:protein phosphatase
MIWTFLKRMFRSRSLRVALFGRTDTGRTRSNNEDSFFIQPRANLMMVADGMGGHNAGEVASRTAIETMARLVDPEVLARAGANQEEICHLLMHALRLSNDRVMAMADESEAYTGMGCTLIVGFVTHGRLYTCHVGDVRAYLLHREGIRQLTADHTYAAEYTRDHQDDPDFDPSAVTLSRNIVSRAIGFPFPDDPECTITTISCGDRILLCQDGLWSMVPDAELAVILHPAATPEEACDRLILAANEAGGKDNITAVVAFA